MEIVLRNLSSKTRKFAWAMLALLILILLVGCLSWGIGFVRLNNLQVAHDQAVAEATREAVSGIPPTLSPAVLDNLYQNAVKAYQSKQYSQAIDNFKKVTASRTSYKDSLALLLLSYKALGQTEANDLALLDQAPTTFGEALSLINAQGTELKQEFGNEPQLLTQIGSYDALTAQIQQAQKLATAYSTANDFQVQANHATPNWWDGAIKNWETVYQTNRNYLQSNPLLWVSVRLADSYQSKATYLCSNVQDYAGALAAIDRALEIGNASKLPDSKMRELQQLFEFITQSQCQAD